MTHVRAHLREVDHISESKLRDPSVHSERTHGKCPDKPGPVRGEMAFTLDSFVQRTQRKRHRLSPRPWSLVPGILVEVRSSRSARGAVTPPGTPSNPARNPIQAVTPHPARVPSSPAFLPLRWCCGQQAYCALRFALLPAGSGRACVPSFIHPDLVISGPQEIWPPPTGLRFDNPALALGH